MKFAGRQMIQLEIPKPSKEVSTGVPGLAFFLWWCGYAFWKSRGGGSPVRFWASVTLFMVFYQMWVYGFLPAQIHILMVAAALAWRERLAPAAELDTMSRERQYRALPVG